MSPPNSDSSADSMLSTEESNWQKLFMAMSLSLTHTISELNLVRGKLDEKENELHQLKEKYDSELETMRRE